MKKFLIALLAIIVIGGGIVYLLIGNPIVFYNSQNMNRDMLHVDFGTITFNDITDFEWDTMYSFDSSMTKYEIEEVLGFESNSIVDSSGDNMMQVIFVKDSKVVCNLNGTVRSLGYQINFVDEVPKYNKILYADKVEFEVRDIENVLHFTEKDLGIVVPDDKKMNIY